MNKNKRDTDKNIIVWLILQSFIIITALIGSFLLVEFGSKYFFGDKNDDNFLLHAAGTLIPMCAFLGALNYFLSQFTYRYISMLADGIKKVANGDFSAHLDKNKAGPLAEVYENFNKMGTELQNVQLLRNDFINSYSHEFKTPITSINGFAALLLDTDVSAEDRQKYLQIIMDESARLADLANSTILVSKLDSQQIISDKKPYSLDEQLRHCTIMLSSNWNDKDILFSGELDVVIYNGNVELMQHLWLNLLNNAIKYTPEHGEVTISLSECNNTAIVQICDTGIGMNEETVSHIFEKYYQGVTLKSMQGLGLGLSIVKRIIDLCGGTIVIKSKENEGSTFIITLPIDNIGSF